MEQVYTISIEQLKDIAEKYLEAAARDFFGPGGPPSYELTFDPKNKLRAGDQKHAPAETPQRNACAGRVLRTAAPPPTAAHPSQTHPPIRRRLGGVVQSAAD